MSEINYDRLYQLNQLVKSGRASKADKDEYMLLLYRNNSITEKQYEDYKHDRYKDDLINAGLTIGGIVLLGWILSKVSD